MLVKICFGNDEGGTRIIECDDMESEYCPSGCDRSFVRHIFYSKHEVVTEVPLGLNRNADHVYVMVDGKTLDHFVYHLPEGK